MIYRHTVDVVPGTIDLPSYLDSASQNGWEFVSLTMVKTKVSPLDPSPQPGFMLFFRRPAEESGQEKPPEPAREQQGPEKASAVNGKVLLGY